MVLLEQPGVHKIPQRSTFATPSPKLLDQPLEFCALFEIQIEQVTYVYIVQTEYPRTPYHERCAVDNYINGRQK